MTSEGGFHNIELPCDWTVNRRPVQNTLTGGKAPGEKEGGSSNSSSTTTAKNNSSKKKRASKEEESSKQRKRHHHHKKKQPQEEEEEEDSEAAETSPRQKTEAAKEKKEEDAVVCTPNATTTNNEPKGKSQQGETKKAAVVAETDAVAIEPHPLGFISVFAASVDDAAATQVGSKRRVKALILKKLEMAAAEAPPQNEEDRHHILDTEGLLSRLPYKKMLSDMFGGSLRGNLRSADIPYVTRAYEEAFMRAPLNSTERECAKGDQCECMFIDRTQPFVGVEFLLPGEALPRTPHLCVLCCRATTQQLYYDVMFDKAEFPGVIQRYGNIHSQPGEYSLDAMLIAVGSAPVHIMPLPIVSHQRNRYSVFVSGGIRRLKQSRVKQWHVMPLFAHWRHAPYSSSLSSSIHKEEGDVSEKSGAKKGYPTAPPGLPSSSTTHHNHIFCAFDDAIEARLHELHQVAKQMLCRDGVQSEIDTYLFACISADLKHLVIPRQSVPHYDNLPDISAYALGVLDPAMDSDPELQQVLLLLRQCMPLRRRTKRAQREVQWRHESCEAIQNLLRCMQGTLLGLYPNCLKGIAFGARMGVLQFLRTVIIQPFEKMHACIQRIPYVTKLCVMEHLCNTIYDYHPGVCHTLNRSGQKVEHFCNSVSTICDIFRGELNSLYCASTSTPAETILQILPRLEKISHSYFERCTRAYRGIIIGNVRRPHSIDHVKRLLQHHHPAGGVNVVFSQILEQAYLACNQSVFDLAHMHSIPEAHTRELAWHVIRLVQVHPLPSTIARQQQRALQQRYNGDTTCINACKNLHLCIQCVVKKGAMQGMRLRHGCVGKEELVCGQCGPGTILTINMLGNIATVCGDSLLLSSCCGCFIYYSGSAFEYSTVCGRQCASDRQLFRKRERVVAGDKKVAQSGRQAKVLLLCFICGQRNSIQQTLRLLDPVRRSIENYSLCSKHVVPRHISAKIYDKDALLLYFRQHALAKRGCAAAGKRR